MSNQTQVVPENDIHLGAEIVRDLIKQLHAIDTFDTYENWSDAKIIDPLILTKERKREIPIIGDPDGLTIARLKCYYNSLSSLIELKSGYMAVPMVNLTHEGFGRAIIMVGKLIVVDKVLRDVHRWGFPSLADLCEQSDKSINKAIELIEKYKGAATD